MGKHFYEFGPFRIDTANHVLLRDGETVPLKPKAFDTLLVLVENRGRVLDKDELMTRLWPDTVVEESNLTQNVYLLRKVLGEEPRGDVYIETMPKRGHRFVARVNEVEDARTDLIPADVSQPRLLVDEKHESNKAPKNVVETAPAIQERPLTASRWYKQASSSKRGVLALTGFLLALGIASVFYVWITSKSKSLEAHGPIKSIAVLPFKPLGSDSHDEELGFGMADTLITRLSSLRQVVVRPTSSVRKFTAPEQDAVAAGRELKVDAVLEATIQRADDRVRVTLRLVSVKDGSLLWTRIVTEQVNDPFAVQDRVAEEVADTLVTRMSGNEKNLLAKRYTENTEAYRLYMLGRYHWNGVTVEDWKKAIDYFNAAIEKDPNYALAYTGLANSYLSLIADSLLPKTEAIPKAKEAAMTALRLDDTLSEAHVASGRIKMYYDWDWAGAEHEFKRAIELSPNSGDAHREYAAYLTNVGRSDHAIAEAKQGRDLDPLMRVTNFQVAWALISAYRYDEAIEQSQQVVGPFPEAHFWIGMAYIGKGMNEQATDEFEKALRLSKEHTRARVALGYALGAAGRRDKAENVLAEFKQLYKQRQGSPYDIAIIYAGLRDKDQAFTWLEESYREHSRLLVSGLKVNPMWDRLRSDPRFADLSRRMGLPQ
jgi:DNA-binding winged helix-turn-helix (wHTH) protein/TolB-like protein/tetratricopeptide (TPR) repeat protein